MHAVQTAGAPPNHGRMNLPIIGCTRKSRNALRNIVAPYTNMPRHLSSLGAARLKRRPTYARTYAVPLGAALSKCDSADETRTSATGGHCRLVRPEPRDTCGSRGYRFPRP